MKTACSGPRRRFSAPRETMKRLYRIVKGRDKDGLFINHMSFNLLLPMLAYSDIHYAGEHEDYENLAVNRLRFSSKPWGLQEALLGSSEHMYSPLHAMISLLHGTGILCQGVQDRLDVARKWMNFRKAYLAFGYKRAVVCRISGTARRTGRPGTRRPRSASTIISARMHS